MKANFEIKKRNALFNFLFQNKLSRKYSSYLKSKFHFFLYEVKIDDLTLKFRSNTSDEYVINEIFNNHEYPFDKFGINKNSTIIDIGAHIGAFCLKASTIVNDGKILCYEPNFDNYRILRKNIKINNLANIRALNYGVADHEGEAKLYIDPIHTGNHSIYRDLKKKSVNIDLTTLDNIIVENEISEIDLLKLDCEGCEYQILYNLKVNNFQLIKQIILEYHNLDNEMNNIKSLTSFLLEKDFKALPISGSTNSGVVLFYRNNKPDSGKVNINKK